MLQFLNRISLFLLTNVLIVVTCGFIIQLFGFHQDLTNFGIDYRILLIYCSLTSFAGSLLNLLTSRRSMKKIYGIKVLNSKKNIKTLNDDEIYLLQMAEKVCKNAGLKKMPEIGIYDDGDVNAFATGFSKNHSLIALSTGLIFSLSEEEIEGVIAHEVAHVCNGDMVTMTLLQGIVNTFVLFLSRLLTMGILKKLKTSPVGIFIPTVIAYYILVSIIDVILLFFGNFILNWFSRYREYRADAFGTKVSGNKVLLALKKLELMEMQGLSWQDDVYKITGAASFFNLFSTHPRLDKRISKINKQLKQSGVTSF